METDQYVLSFYGRLINWINFKIVLLLFFISIVLQLVTVLVVLNQQENNSIQSMRMGQLERNQYKDQAFLIKTVNNLYKLFSPNELKPEELANSPELNFTERYYAIKKLGWMLGIKLSKLDLRAMASRSLFVAMPEIENIKKTKDGWWGGERAYSSLSVKQ